MSADRIEELWTRFLAEGELPAAEEAELAAALHADPALRERILRDKELDGLIDAVAATERDSGAFADAFFDRLSVEGDGARFVAEVEQRIRRDEVPPARRRRLYGTTRPGVPAWVPAVATAAVLAVVTVLVVTLSSGDAPPSEPPGPVVAAPPPPERPPLPPEPASAKEPPRAGTPRPPEAKTEDELRKKAEEAFRKPAEVAKEPGRTPPPAPRAQERPAPPPPPETPPAPATRIAVAKVERVEGEVRGIRAGQDLTAGQSAETGAGGAAVIAYGDGTRLELGPETSARELLDAPKRLLLPRGTVAADVPRQPQPMVVRTPHAEARVLGTSFRISVDPLTTRLEVKTGKVRLTRLSDGKAVDVSSGQVAVAAVGVELAARPLVPKARPVLLAETFEDPRGVDLRWKLAAGEATVKTAGRLEIDVARRAAEGWAGGGLQTRQGFPLPLAVSVDVDVPVLHAGAVAAVVFVPQGQKRRGDGVFRVQLRDRRYSLTTESGEPRDLAGADRAGGAPCRERWRVEVQGNAVAFLANDKEVFRQRHDLAASAGYSIEFDASVRPDAPAGAGAAFDNVLVEKLTP